MKFLYLMLMPGKHAKSNFNSEEWRYATSCPDPRLPVCSHLQLAHSIVSRAL